MKLGEVVYDVRAGGVRLVAEIPCIDVAFESCHFLSVGSELFFRLRIVCT